MYYLCAVFHDFFYLYGFVSVVGLVFSFFLPVSLFWVVWSGQRGRTLSLGTTGGAEVRTILSHEDSNSELSYNSSEDGHVTKLSSCQGLFALCFAITVRFRHYLQIHVPEVCIVRSFSVSFGGKYTHVKSYACVRECRRSRKEPHAIPSRAVCDHCSGTAALSSIIVHCCKLQGYWRR